MGICWWCHWGWPSQIRAIYDRALIALEGDESPLIYGPAHVVWEEENFDNAAKCLEEFDATVKACGMDELFVRSDLEIVRQSLIELVALPDEYKTEPEEYDGENPEAFPPPAHWVMVH